MGEISGEVVGVTEGVEAAVLHVLEEAADWNFEHPPKVTPSIGRTSFSVLMRFVCGAASWFPL